MKNITTRTLIILCAVGLISGLAIASAASAIWSNIVVVHVTTPSWHGTITLSTDSSTYDTSQQVTITATLHDPPTTQQVVTFYFSRMPNANENTPINSVVPLNPATSFIPLIDGDIAKSSVTTVGGIAHISCSVGDIGDYYFKAAVLNPTA